MVAVGIWTGANLQRCDGTVLFPRLLTYLSVSRPPFLQCASGATASSPLPPLLIWPTVLRVALNRWYFAIFSLRADPLVFAPSRKPRAVFTYRAFIRAFQLLRPLFCLFHCSALFLPSAATMNLEICRLPQLPRSVFLAEVLSLHFFSTQPAPFTNGVIPAVLPVKGLR
jgi:hypothetical protein